jgi:serine/threonine protein kinase
MIVNSPKAREVFVAAVKLPPNEWESYLERACVGNPELRQRVTDLLLAHREIDSFMDQPAAGFTGAMPAATAALDPVIDGPGTSIGPYKLLQKLGEGGMGAVWAAEQAEPVKRRVALKLIKAGMDSAQVLHRFEAEREALALMDHTHIAKVLDAGTTLEGRPYFVMELVKGVPITKYCDELHLPLRERLALFLPVCQAIQHAHTKGIIHRDIKPSNVLVAMQDGKPVPKVIDFGVAKALHQKLTEGSMYTEIGQVVGTLEYMSPEQAELSALDIDTRTDVYAMGVLLYELLTGSTPLDRKRLHRAALTEMLRIIKEEEPPKPSTRLTESKESLASLAAQRRIEPAKLARAVRGELDWIVMKCLEKDRTRRYETADGLARDVERHLDDEPVEACPPSAGYRARKFLRRHKGPVLAAALVLLAMLFGMAGTTWGLVRAEKARREAVAEQSKSLEAAEQERLAKEREAEQRALADEQRQLAEEQKALAEANEKQAIAEKQIAEAVRTFLQHDLLHQADATAQANALRQLEGPFEVKENPTIKELLDRAAAELAPGRIEAKFPGQRETQASILWTVGSTYLGIGEYEKAIEFLARASDIYREILGADHLDTLRTLDGLAGAYLFAGRLTEAIALSEQLRDAFVNLLGAGHPRTLTILNNLAWSYLNAGRLPKAIELFEHVRDAKVKDLGVDHPDTLTILQNLAQAYRAAGKLSKAIELYEQVRDAKVKKLGADHPSTIITVNDLADAYMAAGRLPEAIELFEQARDVQVKQLGAEHPHTLTTLHGLATAYKAIGQLSKGIKLFEQVRDAQVKKLGADHPNTLTTLNNLAVAYHFDGRLSAAVVLFEQVRDARVKKLGADHPSTLNTMNNLASACQAAGNFSEAIELFEQVRDAQVKKLGADHPSTLDNLTNLASAYSAAGRLPEAIELNEQVWDAQVKQLGRDHPSTLRTMNNLALAYHAVGRLPRAIELYEQVRDAQVKKLGADHSDALITLNNLAGTYQAAGRLREAIELFERVRNALVKQLGADHPTTLTALGNLASAYEAAGKGEETMSLFLQAAVGMEKRKFQHERAGPIIGNLIGYNERLEQYNDAEIWRRKWLAVVKERAGAESSAYAVELVALGLNLLKQKKWTDAEMVLREGLMLREQLTVGANPSVLLWQVANVKSLLGEALAGQEKNGEAESLLVTGYQGLKEHEATIPPQAKVFLTGALKRLVDFYATTGQAEKADEWRAKLNEAPAEEPPVTP